MTGHSLTQLAAFLTRKPPKEKRDFLKNGLQAACESVTKSLKARTQAVDHTKIDEFITNALVGNEKLAVAYKAVLKIGNEFEGKRDGRFKLNPY